MAKEFDADKAAAALLAAVGENSENVEPKLWLDMGYAPLNKIISGDPTRGFPAGRMGEIAGPSASGKTLLATLAMIATQRAGGIAIFVDWEQAFSIPLAEMLGLNTKFPHFIYKRAATWEEGNTIAMKTAEAIRKQKLIDPEAPITMVCDSIAAAVPKSMMYDAKGNRREIDEYTMNDTTALARVTSTTLKSINQLVGEFNVAAIYLNQIRTKPGVVYGDPRTTPGGGAMEFYASWRLFTGRKKIMATVDGEKEFQGALIGLETVKNKLTRPFQNVELRLMYDPDGRAVFDFTTGYLEELVAMGKLEEKAGRITWEGKTYFKSVLAKKIDDEKLQPELIKLYLS
jgi:recombination protein RecA